MRDPEVERLLAEARATKAELAEVEQIRGGVWINGKHAVRPSGSPVRQTQIPGVRRGTSKRRARAVGMHIGDLARQDQETRQVWHEISKAGIRR